ncbi:MAG: carbohydrate porin, partial [Chloroflexaceae bacterium]|nr:carbohydrate porin [Chloroflexaceae bacterium]
VSDRHRDGSQGHGRRSGDSHLLEVFYEIPLTDNLFLTPGGFIVFLGGSGGNNDDIWVLLLRTSFRI